MSTVFTLTGAVGLSVLMPFQLNGEITTGNTVVPVTYPNLLVGGDADIIAGAATLNSQLVATGGVKVVFALSLGAMVAARWLHDYGPSSAISPANLSFVLIGNPVRKYNGFFPTNNLIETLVETENIIPGTVDLAATTIPEDTPYTVRDIARQYDGLADWPNDETNVLAVSQATAGMNYLHPAYQSVSPSDPGLEDYTEGNITYTWAVTNLLANEYLRPYIEAGYTRPVVITGPVTTGPIALPSSEEKAELERLRQGLLYSDSITAAAAAEELAEMESAVDQIWTVSVYDKMWVKIGELGDDLIEVSGADPRNGMPTATLKVKGESWLTDTFMSCQTTMVGVTLETAGLRFPFYVDEFDYEFDNGPAWVGTAELVGIYDILNYIMIWPQWFMPIQVQLLSHAVYIGQLCMCIEAMVSENALRLQSGIWEFINNAVSLNPDIRAWFGRLLQSNGNIFQMLKTPMYVVRTNPFLDTSPLIARTVRMEPCGKVIGEVTRAYGVDVSVDLWLPGDDQPDYWTENFEFMRLDQPTYVVTAKDRSQIEGPTGTVIDSAVRTVVDVAGSFFSDILPVIQEVPGRDGVFISEQLGLDFVEPWAVLIAPEPGEKGNVTTCRISFHTPKGWQHIIGGRSPKWLNDLMNAAFAWMIDSIAILIGFTGIPSNLLEGFLNNTLLAFQLVQHYERRNEVGPYHPAIEVFHATNSAPYNIETLFGFINAFWDSRGWVSAIVTFRNGEVYTLGKDVFRGGLVSVLYMERTRIFTDYVEEVKFRLDSTHRDILLQVGDGKAEESPLAKHQRFLTGVFESINVVLLTPQSGGLA